MADYAKIIEELQGIAVEDNPALVKQKSRDFYWYSPILKSWATSSCHRRPRKRSSAP